MAEFAPAAALMGLVKGGVHHRHVKNRGVGLLAQLVVVEDFDEHQIGDLLDHRQRVGHAAGPENIPDVVDFRLQFSCYHCASSSFKTEMVLDAVIFDGNMVTLFFRIVNTLATPHRAKCA